MSDFSIYIIVVLVIAISPFLVGIAFYGAVLYANKKYMKEVESRERQAKLEAFWKEEQLRLNPRAVLVDRLPPVEKYHEWGEWDACEQHLAQAERTLIE